MRIRSMKMSKSKIRIRTPRRQMHPILAPTPIPIRNLNPHLTPSLLTEHSRPTLIPVL